MWVGKGLSLAKESPGPNVAWKRLFRQDRDDSSMGSDDQGASQHTHIDMHTTARGSKLPMIRMKLSSRKLSWCNFLHT